MLQQVADMINAQGGAKSRLGHPPMQPDGTRGDAIGQAVGVFQNARVDKDQVRGDIQLGDYAETMPNGGNAKKYLMGIAKQHPSKVGLSVAFAPAPYVSRPGVGGRTQKPLGRVKSVSAVDFVDTAAANPSGLLSQQDNSLDPASGPWIVPPYQGVQMDPKLKAYLVSLGLDPNATEGEAKAFLSALGRDQQVTLSAAGHGTAFKAILGRDPLPAPTVTNPVTEPVVQLNQGGNGGNGGGNGGGSGGPAVVTDPGVVMLAEQKTRDTFLSNLKDLYKLPDDWISEQTVALSELDLTGFYGAAKKAALVALAKKNKPVHVKVGEDSAIVSLQGAVEDCVFERANPGKPMYKIDAKGSVCLSASGDPEVRQPHERANKFAGMTLIEIGRRYLAAIGIDTDGMGRPQLASLLFNRGDIARRTGDVALAMGIGDFPNLLGNVMNRALRSAYAITPVTWDQWAARDSNPDFRPAYRLQLSETDLSSVAPGAPYPETYLTESMETFTLGKFGRILGFNWETLIQDDLNAFGRTPTKMGNACRTLEDTTCYGVFTSNQVMTETGQALFNSTAPSYVKGKNVGGHANLIAGAGQPWYLTAEAGRYDTVVVAFLEGESGPVFEQEDGFATDTRRYKVRHVVTARAIDFRGLAVSSAAISVTNLDALQQLFLAQKDISGKQVLGIDPAVAIVGRSNQVTMKQYMASPVDPSKSNATPNPFQGQYKLVYTPYLP
jgi:hypothetical protein